MAEFILQQKISRMTLKSYGRIANFRKPEKYTLGAEIQAAEIVKAPELPVRARC